MDILVKIFHPEPLEAVYYWEKKNKANYLTWYSIRPKFLKNTSMPKPVKSRRYIQCNSWSSPRLVKRPSNSIIYNCEKICCWSRRPKTKLEIRKNATFVYVINNPIIYKFFKGFTYHRKKTNRAVVFSCRPFPTFLNTGTIDGIFQQSGK